MNILNKTMAIIETWSIFCKNSTKHHTFLVFLIKMNIFCKTCFHVGTHNIKGLSYWIIKKIHHILVSTFNQLEYLDDGYSYFNSKTLSFSFPWRKKKLLFFHSHVFQWIVPSLTNIKVSNPIDGGHYTCDNFIIFDDLPKSCTKRYAWQQGYGFVSFIILVYYMVIMKIDITMALTHTYLKGYVQTWWRQMHY